MSKPANPLGAFNSYAYHHILIACSNTDVADALSAQTDLTQLEHNNPLGKYVPTPVGGLGSYVVIINSTQDAEFYIDDVSWGSIFVPAGTTDSTYDFNSAELDGELTIVEPGGMRFINVMAEIATSLNVAVPSLSFLLKTIFVGQNGAGQTETISGVRPLVFTIVDLTADFDYTGARYKISLVGGQDGYAKHPNIAHIVGGKTMNIVKESSLYDALKKLEATANSVYTTRKDKVVEQQQKALAESGSTETYTEGVDFIPVRYVINPDSTFKNYVAATNNVESTKDQDGGHTVSFQPDLSVHASITRIMETSKQLMDHTSTGFEKDGRNRKFTFKVTDRVHTTKDEMVVTYDIKFYELTTTLQDPDVQLGDDALPPTDSVLEFDYVYTGKNIDIIDFNMKMDLALAYFMTLQSSRPLDSGQAESTSGTKTDDVEGNTDQIQGTGSNTAFGQTLPGPLLIGPQLQSNASKKENVIETANARNVLADFAQMSTIGVTLKIHGTPLLLEQIATPINPDRAAVITTILREASIFDETTDTFLVDWSSIPGYCKINIRMPAGPGAENQYEQFWYEGYYRINSIQHKFDGGEFTQELEIYSMPVETNFRKNTSTTGAPPSPKATRTPPDALPSTSSSTFQDSTNVPSVLFSQFDDKIVAAAKKYDVDPNIMRALFRTESDFNSLAVAGIRNNQVAINGVSKAAGLGQIMPATALWLAHDMMGRPNFRVDAGRDDRFDVDQNIELSTFYVKNLLGQFNGNVDLALAGYNAGPGNVRKYNNTIPPFKETQNYVVKINGLLDLVEPPEINIPASPAGKEVSAMTPSEMLQSFIGL